MFTQAQYEVEHSKCVFAIEDGKLLGFMLTYRGIKANPDKCQAILEMKSLTSMKDVQWLMGRIASLSRFLAASTWKALPFFALLKRESNFEWTPKREATFQEFKSYLSSPPILCKPEISCPLYFYLKRCSLSRHFSSRRCKATISNLLHQ